MPQDGPQPGIYVLWDTLGRAVYVGQSGDIRRRLTEHRKEGKKKFTRATWIQVLDLTSRLQMEGILILAVRPIHNRGVNLGLSAAGRIWEIKYPSRPPRSRKAG